MLVVGASVTASSSSAGVSSTPGAQASPRAQNRHRAPHRQARPNNDDRLVKGLKLDAAQEAEVRRALQDRRDQLTRLFRQPADPKIPRTAAIRAINDRTANRIRAVLNDEQKKLYLQPLPDDYAPGKGKPGVEEWMKATPSKRK